MEILFWVCLFYIGYVEVGYLALLWVLSKFIVCKNLIGDIYPTVTVLIAAYNEEKVIRSKIENTLSLIYPRDLLQIIVVSDCSTDRTDEIVSEFSPAGVQLVCSSPRKGKIVALRAAEKYIKGDLVLFTDADSMLNAGALQTLVRHFADPKTGAVSGRETRPPTGADKKGRGEGFYNKIDTAIKTLEGKIGNQVGVHGGIFIVRRDLLPYVPDHLSHDAIVCLTLTLAGYKTLYEPDAVSVEEYDLDTVQDWRRRIRTVLQSIQSYLYLKKALNPFKTGFYAFQVLSHRFARWFIFPALVIILIVNLFLVDHSLFYLVFMLAQLICYGLAIIGMILDHFGKRPALCYFPFYFVYIHIPAFWAVLLHFSGRKMTIWRPAQRKPSQKTSALPEEIQR